MSREGAIHLACLYGPLAGAALLAGWVRPGRRLATGLLFALAWNAALLPWLDALARAAGLWEYRPSPHALGGMPLALYFGWILGWGLFAPLLARALGDRIWIAALLLVAIDLRAMPEMTPVLVLHPGWIWGELAVVALLLLPSLWLARWTERRERTGLRCAMLVPAFGGVFLGLPLLVIGGNHTGILDLWNVLPPVSQALFLTGAFAFSVPGLAAVRDLARTGDGTPVPLDPPRRLVTHGIYAFVRNPMQLSMTLLLLLESLFLRNPWPLVLAAVGVVYSEGFARWSENEDMRRRFGPAWTRYHGSVRPWIPGWTPRIGEECELFLDGDCGSCAEVARWFQNRTPFKLRLINASEWPGPPLRRVTWHHPASGRTESGVSAIAMALQHLSLPWAVAGWIAGIPGISQALQICFDAAGTGPVDRLDRRA